jgi:uncharacterized membrane protein
MIQTNQERGSIAREEVGRESDHVPFEAMLCYLPIFCLYPWSQRRELPGIADHARQGMILFGVEVFLFLVTVPAFYKLLWLVVAVMAGLGVWSAFNGRSFRLPVLGDLADKLEEQDTKSAAPTDKQ